MFPEDAVDKIAALNDSTPEPVVAEPVESPEPVVVETPVAVNTNPAWNSLLENVPEMLHDKIKPQLAEWDQNYQKSFDKYKPYDEFVGVDPGQLRASRQLMQALETDPMRVYENLRVHLEANGQLQAQQQEEVEDLSGDEDFQEDPRLVQMQQGLQRMEQLWQQQENAKVQAEADNWMNNQQAQVTEALKAKGIDPDWNHILPVAAGLIQSGVDPDKAMSQAVGGFEALVTKYRPSANNGAPLLMPPGSSSPSTAPVNPATMDEKQRKSFAAQMLTQAFKD